jgi:peptide/nickel transport system substrate-binding protein
MAKVIRRQPLRLLLLLAGLALVLTACPGGEEPRTGEGQPDGDEDGDEEPEDREISEGGTVVWAYEQEPGTLNPVISDGNLYATSQIALATLLPLWKTTPDFEYEPTALLDDYEVAGTDMDPDADPADLEPEEQFRVTYQLNEDAEWSDGEPITARDLFFTIEVNLHPDIDITSRAGWDAIDVETTEEQMDPDSKELTVYFEEPYAPWQSSLFNNAFGVVLPEHVLSDHLGEEFNEVFRDGIVDPDSGEPIASGPMMFDTWDRGQQVELVRNENFETYAGENANLDRVIYRIIPDINTQLQQLRGGEIDMMDPQVQLDIIDQVEGIEGVEYQTDAGPTWEHLDFQHTHPLLGEQWLREAIAHAINREEFVSEFIEPVYPDAEPLGNHAYMTNDPNYEDHFDWLEYDPERSREILEENGCEEGDDGIYVCDGQRLEFELTSTAGNERRELFFDFAQQDLQEVGIELTEAYGDPATVFGSDVLVAGDWEMFLFAWVGGPDPSSMVEILGCFERDEDGAPLEGADPEAVSGPDDERYGNQNYHRHCPSAELSQQLLETRWELDEDERHAKMNEAVGEIARDIPTLPIFQMPDFLAYNEDLAGLEINTTQWGQTWNIEEWGWLE